MSQDGVWGDCIALWGLVNMLNIDVAVISSLAATTTKTGHEFRRMALLGHEAESHYHSLDDLRLEDVDDEDAVAKMKKKRYGVGINVTPLSSVLILNLVNQSIEALCLCT